MKVKPAIVICAYNRPCALKRLLDSINAAQLHEANISLVISIDKSIDSRVAEIAEEFNWAYGTKEIILQQERLGLKQHILFCGRLSLTYGAVIVLEDDLLVSPYFYTYAQAAYDFYKDDLLVAGISLYNYLVTEGSFYQFKAVDDNTDVYFLQVAASLGQLWTRQQWQNFEDWFKDHPQLEGNNIPQYLYKWGEQSWKKHFIHYLIASSKYFVFPRLSLTTNFEDAGTNPSAVSFQVPIQLCRNSYNFCRFADSAAVYDSSFEILPRCIDKYTSALQAFNYEVDLFGTKEIIENEFDYILTSKQAQQPIRLFADRLLPLEANIILNLQGSKIGLYKKAGNRFSADVYLPVFNYLKYYHEQRAYSITVVIPVDSIDLEQITVTVESVISQGMDRSECLIILPGRLAAAYQNFCFGYDGAVRLIVADNDVTTEALITLGFKNATGQILSWTFAGNTYEPGAFLKVRSVFRSHTLSWIAGLNTAHDALRDQRLTRNDIYERLARGTLNTDTQQHFFRDYCVADMDKNSDSLQELFFHLSSLYDCNIIMFKLGNIKQNLPALTRHQTKAILNKFGHFKYRPKSLVVKMVYRLLKSQLLSENLRYKLRLKISNLPDIVRFTDSGEVSYLSKY